MATGAHAGEEMVTVEVEMDGMDATPEPSGGGAAERVGAAHGPSGDVSELAGGAPGDVGDLSTQGERTSVRKRPVERMQNHTFFINLGGKIKPYALWSDFLRHWEREHVVPAGPSQRAIEDAKKKRPSWFTWSHQPIRHSLLPAGGDAEINGSIFNLANSVLGSGILGLSEAMSFMGWVPMLLFLILSGYLCYHTAVMLARVASAESTETYGDTALKLLGPKGAVVVESIIVLGNFGTLVAYIVLVGDFAELVGADIGHDASREFWAALLAMLVMLPLSLKRDLNELRGTSFVSVLFVCFFLVSLFIRFCQAMRDDGVADSVTAGRFDADFFRAIPTCFFGFNAHTAVLPVYRAMKNQTPERFEKVSAASFSTVGFMYVIAAVSGYLMFGDTASGNLLQNFSDDNLMMLATIAFAFTIAFTFPIVITALRISLHYLCFGQTDITDLQFYCETIGTFVVAVLVGISVTDVSLVFSITGSIASGFIAFVFPAWLLLRSEAAGATAGERKFCWFLIAFGVVACIVGLTTSFMAA